MRVVRLEVFGFKSFMERLVLPLDGGVTGIVGPNGCGKSNTVDALRWVMGETRASHLRGGVLEDVIFNGTAKLRPLGLAEVTLTLRADSSDFLSDVVSPELEAQLLVEEAEREVSVATSSEQGSSERGMVEVPSADAGVEIPSEEAVEKVASEVRPQLSVIEGALSPEAAGEVDSQDGPELDLAAEIKSHAQDPQQAATLAARFAWLRNVTEVQVTRRLYRSGESEFFINRVPVRLKDLKDFLRAVGLGPRTYTIVAQGEVTRIISARPEERRQILEEAAGVLGFRDKIAAATRRLEEGTQSLARVDDVIKEVTRQVNSLRLQASRAKNRQGLKEQIVALERALFSSSWKELQERELEIQAASSQLEAAEAEGHQQLGEAETNEAAAREQLSSIDEELSLVREQMDTLREEINRCAAERSRRIARVNEVRVMAQARVTELRRLEDRSSVLQERAVECQRELAELDQQDNELQSQLQQLGTQGEEDLRALAERLQQTRQELKSQEIAIRETRDLLIRAQSRVASVMEQLVASSPLNQLRRTTQGKDQAELEALGADAKLFIEMLRVPEQYLRALQAILAERSAFIVSRRPHDVARYFLSNVLDGEKAKRERVGLGVLRGDGENQGEVSEGSTTSALHELHPELIPLLQVVEIGTEARAVAREILRSVYVAATAEEALQVFERAWVKAEEQGGTLDQSYADAKIVTLDGDVLTAYSFYSLRHEGGLVQLKHQQEQLELEVHGLEAKLTERQSERDICAGTVSELEELQAQLLREIQLRQQRIREISSAQGNVRGRIQSARRLEAQISGDIQRTTVQISELQTKIAEGGREEEIAQAELDALGEDQEAQKHEQLRGLRAACEEKENTRRSVRQAAEQQFRNLQQLRHTLDAVRGKMSQYRVDIERTRSDRSHLEGRYSEEFGAEGLQEALAILSAGSELADAQDQRSVAEKRDELSKLRARIQREGEVDYSSISRFEEEQKRLEDLEGQRKDLSNAQHILQRTIERLSETSRERFLATFNAVRENFSRIAPRLFGGGKADIELINSQDPLESGLEIVARPPGKKLKSIELMSGGEKCLCATALIFSMFLVRPSPLCVLDEVDAPLDEANLMRFLTVIREMSKQTQFLVITHNKGTMAVADRLIGVTMQEPGASRMISVSLQDAYAQVA